MTKKKSETADASVFVEASEEAYGRGRVPLDGAVKAANAAADKLDTLADAIVESGPIAAIATSLDAAHDMIAGLDSHATSPHLQSALSNVKRAIDAVAAHKTDPHN